MEAVLVAKIRDKGGSRYCRKLRESGVIPANLYGQGDNLDLSLDTVEVLTYFRKVASRELKLMVSDSPVDVRITEVQRHPISQDILHVDFCRKK